MAAPLPAAPGWLIEPTGEHSLVGLHAGHLVECIESPYQRIEVWDGTQLGRLYRLDGVAMAAEGDEWSYHEPLAHLPALCHPQPRRALVLGGGDGGSAEELLKHPCLEQLTLVELDAEVLAMAQRHLVAIHRGVFNDPRLQIVVADALQFVPAAHARGERYDLIVFDLTDPVGASAPLYAAPFLSQCRALLAPGGELSLHTASPVFAPALLTRLLAALRASFPRVSPVFVNVPLYGGLWGLACAGEGPGPAALDSAELQARIDARRLYDLRWLCPSSWQAALALPPWLHTLCAAAR